MDTIAIIMDITAVVSNIGTVNATRSERVLNVIGSGKELPSVAAMLPKASERPPAVRCEGTRLPRATSAHPVVQWWGGKHSHAGGAPPPNTTTTTIAAAKHVAYIHIIIIYYYYQSAYRNTGIIIIYT